MKVKSIECPVCTVRVRRALACCLGLGLALSPFQSWAEGEPAPAAPAGAGLPAATAPASASPAAPAAAGAAAPSSPLNPAPAEFPSHAGAASNLELDRLLSRVAALRSRIAALTQAVFASKLRIEVRAGGDAIRLKALSVSLDGGVVYTAPAQAAFEEPQIVFEHSVAPGAHVIAVEVERHDNADARFSTWQVSRFVVVVPEKRLLWTRFTLEGDSNMGEDFAEDEAGTIELGVELAAEVSE